MSIKQKLLFQLILITAIRTSPSEPDYQLTATALYYKDVNGRILVVTSSPPEAVHQIIKDDIKSRLKIDLPISVVPLYESINDIPYRRHLVKRVKEQFPALYSAHISKPVRLFNDTRKRMLSPLSKYWARENRLHPYWDAKRSVDDSEDTPSVRPPRPKSGEVTAGPTKEKKYTKKPHSDGSGHTGSDRDHEWHTRDDDPWFTDPANPWYTAKHKIGGHGGNSNNPNDRNKTGVTDVSADSNNNKNNDKPFDGHGGNSNNPNDRNKTGVTDDSANGNNNKNNDKSFDGHGNANSNDPNDKNKPQKTEHNNNDTSNTFNNKNGNDRPDNARPYTTDLDPRINDKPNNKNSSDRDFNGNTTPLHPNTTNISTFPWDSGKSTDANDPMKAYTSNFNNGEPSDSLVKPIESSEEDISSILYNSGDRKDKQVGTPPSTKPPLTQEDFIPNDIYYGIEKSCVNWNPLCDLKSPGLDNIPARYINFPQHVVKPPALQWLP